MKKLAIALVVVGLFVAVPLRCVAILLSLWLQSLLRQATVSGVV